MARINSRAKGASGEREAALWLFEHTNLPAIPERNLEQVRSGGSDLLYVEPLCVEVKRVENLSLTAWWNQVVKAAQQSPRNLIPIVMFRKNRKPWEFLIPAALLGIHHSGFIRVDRFVFVKYVNEKVYVERDPF
jgi:hypothetical protein